MCNVRPEKDEVNSTRFVVGGNRINYSGDVGTPTADMLLAKILFNGVFSTKNARFMMGDIKNFYLNTPLKRKGCIKLKLADIPQEVTTEYKLKDISTKDDSVYLEVNKGMHGLPQAGLLAQELLQERLAHHGYHQSETLPVFWKHESRPIVFTLLVDDFGVRYVNKEDAEHLMSVSKQNYEVTEDWEGGRYIGMHLRWDYSGRKVHFAMPGYAEKVLRGFLHEHPRRKQCSPFYMCTKEIWQRSTDDRR